MIRFRYAIGHPRIHIEIAATSNAIAKQRRMDYPIMKGDAQESSRRLVVN